MPIKDDVLKLLLKLKEEKPESVEQPINRWRLFRGSYVKLPTIKIDGQSLRPRIYRNAEGLFDKFTVAPELGGKEIALTDDFLTKFHAAYKAKTDQILRIDTGVEDEEEVIGRRRRKTPVSTPKKSEEETAEEIAALILIASPEMKFLQDERESFKFAERKRLHEANRVRIFSGEEPQKMEDAYAAAQKDISSLARIEETPDLVDTSEQKLTGLKSYRAAFTDYVTQIRNLEKAIGDELSEIAVDETSQRTRKISLMVAEVKAKEAEIKTLITGYGEQLRRQLSPTSSAENAFTAAAERSRKLFEITEDGRFDSSKSLEERARLKVKKASSQLLFDERAREETSLSDDFAALSTPAATSKFSLVELFDKAAAKSEEESQALPFIKEYSKILEAFGRQVEVDARAAIENARKIEAGEEEIYGIEKQIEAAKKDRDATAKDLEKNEAALSDEVGIEKAFEAAIKAAKAGVEGAKKDNAAFHAAKKKAVADIILKQKKARVAEAKAGLASIKAQKPIDEKAKEKAEERVAAFEKDLARHQISLLSPFKGAQKDSVALRDTAFTEAEEALIRIAKKSILDGLEGRVKVGRSNLATLDVKIAALQKSLAAKKEALSLATISDAPLAELALAKKAFETSYGMRKGIGDEVRDVPTREIASIRPLITALESHEAKLLARHAKAKSFDEITRNRQEYKRSGLSSQKNSFLEEDASIRAKELRIARKLHKTPSRTASAEPSTKVSSFHLNLGKFFSNVSRGFGYLRLTRAAHYFYKAAEDEFKVTQLDATVAGDSELLDKAMWFSSANKNNIIAIVSRSSAKVRESLMPKLPMHVELETTTSTKDARKFFIAQAEAHAQAESIVAAREREKAEAIAAAARAEAATKAEADAKAAALAATRITAASFLSAITGKKPAAPTPEIQSTIAERRPAAPTPEIVSEEKSALISELSEIIKAAKKIGAESGIIETSGRGDPRFSHTFLKTPSSTHHLKIKCDEAGNVTEVELFKAGITGRSSKIEIFGRSGELLPEKSEIINGILNAGREVVKREAELASVKGLVTAEESHEIKGKLDRDAATSIASPTSPAITPTSSEPKLVTPTPAIVSEGKLSLLAAISTIIEGAPKTIRPSGRGDSSVSHDFLKEGGLKDHHLKIKRDAAGNITDVKLFKTGGIFNKTSTELPIFDDKGEVSQGARGLIDAILKKGREVAGIKVAEGAKKPERQSDFIDSDDDEFPARAARRTVRRTAPTSLTEATRRDSAVSTASSQSIASRSTDSDDERIVALTPSERSEVRVEAELLPSRTGPTRRAPRKAIGELAAGEVAARAVAEIAAEKATVRASQQSSVDYDSDDDSDRDEKKPAASKSPLAATLAESPATSSPKPERSSSSATTAISARTTRSRVAALPKSATVSSPIPLSSDSDSDDDRPSLASATRTAPAASLAKPEERSSAPSSQSPIAERRPSPSPSSRSPGKAIEAGAATTGRIEGRGVTWRAKIEKSSETPKGPTVAVH